MAFGGKRKPEKKSSESEDWCFVCKDGGELILCDHRDCIKVYHADCVESDDSLLETKKSYTCERHVCMECGKASNFYCLCCPTGVCKHCCGHSEFAILRGKNGLCTSCLESVIRCEERAEYDENGDKLDYDDRETYECLFKEYWDIMKEKEDITLEDIYSADARLKKGQNGKHEVEIRSIISYSKSRFVDKPMGRTIKGSKKEFIGWGSKPLIEFLTSIGKDTSSPISQYEVDSIISEYIQEKRLFHPEKKKKVLCDERLFSIFRKKEIIKNMVYNLLEKHFADNYLDLSEEEGEIEDNTPTSRKKQKTTPSSDGISPEKNIVGMKVKKGIKVKKTCFASIVVDNIKLVYLRKSLVEELLKESETFESKIVGSFVKVKSDPRDYMHKSPYQLSQVTGIKRISTGEIHLQLSSIPSEVPISALCDYSCTEDDCEDLREKVKNGIFRKLNIVEVEEKAKVLHELITKDWIPRELVRLQNRIDYMNEKGRRRELLELLEKRTVLRQPEEQTRLLAQVPEVIAEEIQVGPDSLEPVDGSPESTPPETPSSQS